MTEQTARLRLPYILPSQAQKHVTHNEALQRLDAIVQLVVRATVATPPEDAVEGDCFLLSAGATGDWAGKGGRLAFRQDGAWLSITPQPGWTAWFAAESRYRALQDGNWRDLPLPASGRLERLGIGTEADAANRMALASPASLFTHGPEDGSHRMTVNKAGKTDTASLLFQSGWSGRAEIGLAGSDGFSIKTSADGATWHTALLCSGDGRVSMPNRALTVAGLPAGTTKPANGSAAGFSVLFIAEGGFTLGDVVSGGGRELVVPAKGLYLAVLGLAIASSSGHRVTLFVNGAATSFSIAGNVSATGTQQSATSILPLDAGDRLRLQHEGTAEFTQGDGKTCLSLATL
ncbi:DUF2793 domain-containing protein [Agrobacterium salinitolerans]|uniref:DUF2793 domain-containing protein n=1 Tax=Agrobacterium salinitolerans TaxID=1183413 RepID=UPI0022B80D2F|nr:DUF2793 domain-containing protein [Agrobacterium salinitolerans]MCZ7851583.1 DUF2793 domain-containing protein [Agrobacterium salinitolerans]MCZ7976551.1 DUF2793 domain-containing protein [Agrobacterium salinitolerans]